MFIEKFLELMNTRVTITNGHVLIFILVISWMIFIKLRQKPPEEIGHVDNVVVKDNTVFDFDWRKEGF